ncbi:MAG: hypothetical protein U9Q15_00780 [Patescibacteria group bacterium]|nr:hypothetical protein [Patescibacteria group bacterium]
MQNISLQIPDSFSKKQLESIIHIITQKLSNDSIEDILLASHMESIKDQKNNQPISKLKEKYASFLQ